MLINIRWSFVPLCVLCWFFEKGLFCKRRSCYVVAVLVVLLLLFWWSGKFSYFFFNVYWRIILCACMCICVLLFPCEVFCSFTIIQMGKSILLVRILLLNAMILMLLWGGANSLFKKVPSCSLKLQILWYFQLLSLNDVYVHMVIGLDIVMLHFWIYTLVA